MTVAMDKLLSGMAHGIPDANIGEVAADEATSSTHERMVGAISSTHENTVDVVEPIEYDDRIEDAAMIKHQAVDNLVGAAGNGASSGDTVEIVEKRPHGGAGETTEKDPVVSNPLNGLLSEVSATASGNVQSTSPSCQVLGFEPQQQSQGDPGLSSKSPELPDDIKSKPPQRLSLIGRKRALQQLRTTPRAKGSSAHEAQTSATTGSPHTETSGANAEEEGDPSEKEVSKSTNSSSAPVRGKTLGAQLSRVAMNAGVKPPSIASVAAQSDAEKEGSSTSADHVDSKMEEAQNPEQPQARRSRRRRLTTKRYISMSSNSADQDFEFTPTGVPLRLRKGAVVGTQDVVGPSHNAPQKHDPTSERRKSTSEDAEGATPTAAARSRSQRPSKKSRIDEYGPGDQEKAGKDSQRINGERKDIGDSQQSGTRRGEEKINGGQYLDEVATMADPHTSSSTKARSRIKRSQRRGGGEEMANGKRKMSDLSFYEESDSGNSDDGSTTSRKSYSSVESGPAGLSVHTSKKGSRRAPKKPREAVDTPSQRSSNCSASEDSGKVASGTSSRPQRLPRAAKRRTLNYADLLERNGSPTDEESVISERCIPSSRRESSEQPAPKESQGHKRVPRECDHTGEGTATPGEEGAAEDGGDQETKLSVRRPSRAAKKRDINYAEGNEAAAHDGVESDGSAEPEVIQKRSGKGAQSSEFAARGDANKAAVFDDIKGSDIPRCEKGLLDSVMSSCNSKEEWLSFGDEMLTVCNEAARRSTLQADPEAERYDKPVSDIYIQERVEFANPLIGFLVRMKAPPNSMQGFVIATPFISWRRSFRWMMDGPASGITPTDHYRHTVDDGSLTRELIATERIPCENGAFMFKRVAEIALLGGLGCGGALLGRALSDLRESGNYDFVVLQSTKMAIAFYEKQGFVRVGAVGKFSDYDRLPDVAYRHWSEYIGREAEEPSYMMAMRLRGQPGAALMRSDRDAAVVRAEVTYALKSSYKLLVEAMGVRANGTKANTSTYKDLIAIARAFAVSAKDTNMAEVIDKALFGLSGVAVGQSRSCLRDELNLPKDIKTSTSTSSATTHRPRKTAAGVAVVVRFERSGELPDTGAENSGRRLRATVPSDFLIRRLNCVKRQVGLSLTIGHERFRPPSNEVSEGQNHLLSTNIYMPIPRDNLDEMKEATAIALDNLRSLLAVTCAEENSNGTVSNRAPSSPRVQDLVYVSVTGYDGAPLWREAMVERQCSETEMPATSTSNRKNAFVVSYLEEDTWHEQPVVLDPSRRGVGRQWCTWLDYRSFCALPVPVIDALVLGSTVRYVDPAGRRVEGIFTHRVGGGLDSWPVWHTAVRVRRKRKHSNTKFHPTLAASDIAEWVQIDDDKYRRTKALLSKLDAYEAAETSTNNDDTRSTTNRKSFMAEGDRKMPAKTRVPYRVPDEDVEAWVNDRIERFGLLNVDHNEDDSKPCGAEVQTSSGTEVQSEVQTHCIAETTQSSVEETNSNAEAQTNGRAHVNTDEKVLNDDDDNQTPGGVNKNKASVRGDQQAVNPNSLDSPTHTSSDDQKSRTIADGASGVLPA